MFTKYIVQRHATTFVKFLARLFIVTNPILINSVTFASDSPVLYHSSFFQSPVTARPETPLILTGKGLARNSTVLYEPADLESKEYSEFIEVPNSLWPQQARVIHFDGATSVTILWPGNTTNGSPYRIWLVTPEGVPSNQITVNDPRPLWFTPSSIYERAETTSQARYLKIVGRNLSSVAGGYHTVRLTNTVKPEKQYTIPALSNNANETKTNPYVISVPLPETVERGEYRVEISLDGTTWKEIQSNRLLVKETRQPTIRVSLEKFGCLPNDSTDDTACFVKAINEVIQSASRGIVTIGAGAWIVHSGEKNSIVVPKGVSLLGVGASSSTVVNDTSIGHETRRLASPWFILEGENSIEGITFRDRSRYSQNRSGPAIIQLGKRPKRTLAALTNRHVSNIVIRDNVFDKPFRAITDSGTTLRELSIVNNEFGAYETAIHLNGYTQTGEKFNIIDSRIINNRFYPGSFMNVASGRGTIATQIGASTRLDFSNNTADGSSTKYLYPSEKESPGWRAAFFWHLRNNHEMMLVSNNLVSCSGDKNGDGESFAFDNNHNTFGYNGAIAVVAASSSTVTVSRRPKAHTKISNFYVGHWIHVVSGAGVGQARKIHSYSNHGDRTTYTVYPDWDVAPDRESKISVGLEFWQITVAGNSVDHGKPLCRNKNRRRNNNIPHGAGGIVLWAQATDLTIANNNLVHTNGIRLHPLYRIGANSCEKCNTSIMLQYSIDVTDNSINEEYDWNSGCSWSGIMITAGASPKKDIFPITIAYGINIVGNRVEKADGLLGGAISITPSWWSGPKSPINPLVQNTVIAHNTLRDLPNTPTTHACKKHLKHRPAIVISSPTTSNTVMALNICEASSHPKIIDMGTSTVKLTKPRTENSCIR